MASPEHCLYCFEVLAAELEGRPALSYDQVCRTWRQLHESSTASQDHTNSTTDSTDQDWKSASNDMSRNPSTAQYPLFVTWNKISSRSQRKSLRGCIGTFEPMGLAAGLSDYAITAALHDTRFSPISAAELPSLSCNVTILTNFTPASHPLEWDIGTHGIRISFFDTRRRRYSATYLPDVAVEQGWSKEETMLSLMDKAGWRSSYGGSLDHAAQWKAAQKEVEDLQVVRYEGSKASLGWDDFDRWRRR